MPNRFTRRDWAATVSAALAGGVNAQTTDTPETLLQQAKEQRARTRDTLKKFKLQRAAEPSFQFKA
jgi:hypothetical protein